MTTTPNSTAPKTLEGIEALLTESIGDKITWTPNDDETKMVVAWFLKSEPTWASAAIRRDPALYKHFNLSENDPALLHFLGKAPDGKTAIQPISLENLVETDKISQETADAVMKELKIYQGLHAIAFDRIANALYKKYENLTAQGNHDEALKYVVLARAISQGVRRLTAGIEIHPGATIGKDFFIDHGTGVVIGETAKIGDNDFLYHGVTLGASSGYEDNGRRHPSIGDDAIISTGVNILGPAIIGKGVHIGSDALIKGKVTIGDGARIRDRVATRYDILPGRTVIDTAPAWFGLTGKNGEKEAGQPIYKPVSIVGAVKQGAHAYRSELAQMMRNLVDTATGR